MTAASTSPTWIEVQRMRPICRRGGPERFLPTCNSNQPPSPSSRMSSSETVDSRVSPLVCFGFSRLVWLTMQITTPSSSATFRSLLSAGLVKRSSSTLWPSSSARSVSKGMKISRFGHFSRAWRMTSLMMAAARSGLLSGTPSSDVTIITPSSSSASSRLAMSLSSSAAM